ncbi:hypothetical protein HII31_12623 [Pseudocercospora fuligena]|uniref:Zn(2)-C6 fungal-type domain-containing protein n=1 Tax=Pseudocercospora fuligena TaxID=685502 RepID=A0A8H6VFB3_9PEZI|nr:hypothetical protein HII31_12623 [Pseudocercospora fuligena]
MSNNSVLAFRTASLPSGQSSTSNAAKTKRIKSADFERLPGEEGDGPYSAEADLQHLLRRIFDTVIDRLRELNMNVSSVSPAGLAFLLPRELTKESRENWYRLLHYPMLLTDTRVRSILKMYVSTKDSAGPDPGTTEYYVRSTEVTIRQLLSVITALENKGITYDEFRHWKAMTAHVRDGETSVFIRYVGMSSSVSAFHRFADDLVKRQDGVYGQFYKTLMQLNPSAVADSTRVYTFPVAATRPFRNPATGALHLQDSSEIDIKESALIALFGKDTLLNRQHGGFHRSYLPSDEDMALFQKLGTKVFSLLEEMVDGSEDGFASPGEGARTIVNGWMARVAQFGRDHPDELGTGAIPVSDSMELEWAKQAYPPTIKGGVLIVFVGDYCPVEAMLKPDKFWKQPLRAVQYLRDTLARLRALEDHQAVFPWIDYQYTPKRDFFREESAEFMRQFLDEFKPYIVVTYERQTSLIVHGDFAGTYNAERKFYNVAGIPKISYHTHRGDITGGGSKAKVVEFDVDPNDSFIQVPLYHPGADKHTSQPRAFRRFCDISSFQIPLLMEVVAEMLPRDAGTSRIEFIEDIMVEFKSRWEGSGCAAALGKARQDLQEFFGSKQTQWSKQDPRQHKPEWNGAKLEVNQSGIAQIYWIKPNGKHSRITIAGGRDKGIAPKKVNGVAEDRFIHFVPEGIDIRDAAGNSIRYKRYKREFINPTFPGRVLLEKMDEAGMGDCAELWEFHTDLNFNDTFALDQGVNPCKRCIDDRKTCDGKRPCSHCKKAAKGCAPPPEGYTGKKAAASTAGKSSSTGNASATKTSSTKAGQKRTHSTTPGLSIPSGGILPTLVGEDEGDQPQAPRKSTRAAARTSKAPPPKKEESGKVQDSGDKPKSKKQKVAATAQDDDEDEDDMPVKPGRKQKKAAAPAAAPEEDDDEDDQPIRRPGRRAGRSSLASIGGKCKPCRLGGRKCDGGQPCNKCTFKPQNCIYD